MTVSDKLIPASTDPEVRVQFPALPDFLSSGSGTGSIKPQEYK
jgi:hypothetical protein